MRHVFVLLEVLSRVSSARKIAPEPITGRSDTLTNSLVIVTVAVSADSTLAFRLAAIVCADVVLFPIACC